MRGFISFLQYEMIQYSPSTSSPPSSPAHTWAVDSVVVGGSALVPNALLDDLTEEEPHPGAWIQWPGGARGHVCGE